MLEVLQEDRSRIEIEEVEKKQFQNYQSEGKVS